LNARSRDLKNIVIIPTYNEKENIEKIIRKVFSLEERFHILIVDDGSPDGTAEIVKGLQKKFTEQLHIEERTGKLGLGTAYIHGFKWCLAKGYDYIFDSGSATGIIFANPRYDKTDDIKKKLGIRN